MDGAGVLKALEAENGAVDAAELQAVLNHLSLGAWTNGKFEKLVKSLGTSADGKVNVAKLFEGGGDGKPAGLKVAIFSARQYVQQFMGDFIAKFPGSFFLQEDCTPETAHMCEGATAVCVFVNDNMSRAVLEVFAAKGVKLALLRCAGFDRVDLAAAKELGIKVARVPAYSPWAVAEHAVSLAVTVNRRLHLVPSRIRMGNFELSGLVGQDFNGKTAGIIGTGRIGCLVAKIFKAFGMEIACYDMFPSEHMKALGGVYMSVEEVLAKADVISLHVPLLPNTVKLINHKTISMMKPGVIIINTARGGLIDTQALIDGISNGIIRAAGLDVYEQEASVFFRDFSVMDNKARMKAWDPTFALLKSFNNVLITPHSAFLTTDALNNICATTILNAEEFAAGKALTNEVHEPPQKPVPPPEQGEVEVLHTVLERKKMDAHREELQSAGGPPPNPNVKTVIFSATTYVRAQMKRFAREFPSVTFTEVRCSHSTAALCAGAQAVCLFVNDDCDREVLQVFKEHGVQVVLLRCAGFDRVDLAAAEELGIKVVRVPAYSPFAVAEHAVALCMCINRRLHRCYSRSHEGIYSLSGLVGMDLNGKVCGIVGTGKIGQIAAKIFQGIGMEVICYDPYQNKVITEELGLQYVELDELYARCDVISLHVPLLESTKYLINDESIAKMKHGVLLINVSRGGLVDTKALVRGLSSSHVGGAGLDVYEHEKDLFFQNFAEMDDDDMVNGYDHTFMHLRMLPNVVVTPHTAFLTQEALSNICSTTTENLRDFVAGKELKNEVKAPPK